MCPDKGLIHMGNGRKRLAHELMYKHVDFLALKTTWYLLANLSQRVSILRIALWVVPEGQYHQHTPELQERLRLWNNQIQICWAPETAYTRDWLLCPASHHFLLKTWQNKGHSMTHESHDWQPILLLSGPAASLRVPPNSATAYHCHSAIRHWHLRQFGSRLKTHLFSLAYGRASWLLRL